MVLIGYWPLNEESGEAHDYSGNGNHGTLNGGITQGATGLLGENSYSFSSDGGEVNFGDSLPFSDDNSFTYSVWIRPESLPSSETYNIIGNKGRRRNLQLKTDGSITLNGYDGSNQGFSTSSAAPTEEWTYIAVTYNGTDAKIYINSKLDQRGEFSYTEGSDYDDIISVSSEIGNALPVNGKISEVRIYDRPLTPSEVQYLYSVGKRGLQTTSKKTS